MSDAAQLANRTVPIGNDPGNYAVTLDVFHELHCLVSLPFPHPLSPCQQLHGPSPSQIL